MLTISFRGKYFDHVFKASAGYFKVAGRDDEVLVGGDIDDYPDILFEDGDGVTHHLLLLLLLLLLLGGVWHGMVWHAMPCHGMVWYGMA